MLNKSKRENSTLVVVNTVVKSSYGTEKILKNLEKSSVFEGKFYIVSKRSARNH